MLATSSLKTPLHYAVSHSLRQSASLHSYRGETFSSSQMMGFSAASNRSEQQSHRHHSAPLDDAIGRCCSEFGVLAVSSGKVGKVDCCGLMRGAGASTAGLLLFLSLSFSIYLTLSHSLSGLPPLPPTVPHFVSLLSFPRLSLIYCRSIFCRTNYKKSTYTLTHVISSHYEVFS